MNTSPGSPPRRTLALLGLLYFCQGLPFGFQATALPAWLRTAGMDLKSIGLLSALAAPWMFKALWAPLVDRYGSRSFGRRKSWIFPTQLGLATLCLMTSTLDLSTHLTPILFSVFAMNLLAATQDIAVDGLACDLLPVEQLGPANAAQVVGYKVGMFTGGGLLVWASESIGWAGQLQIMGVAIGLAAAVVLWVHEPNEGPTPERQQLSGVLKVLGQVLVRPGAVKVLLLVATYKLGETVIDGMYKPFLVDHGYTPAQIGQWVGTWGMLASLVGSAVGGFLTRRGHLLDHLVMAAWLRTLAMGGEVWLTLGHVGEVQVAVVTCAEHLTGGILTTLMFTFMMAQVDRRIGATHFALLATVEALGKSPGALLSGYLAYWLGYPGAFTWGVALSLLFQAGLMKLRHTPAIALSSPSSTGPSRGENT